LNTATLFRVGLAAAVLLGGSAGGALAAPDGGNVEGKVALPAKIGSPPARGQGFVPRMPNPITETRKYDPRPEMVVVLVGGEVAAEDQTAPSEPRRYTLSGESFERLVLPTQVGQLVEIKNLGRSAPILHSPDSDLLASETLNPSGVRGVTVKTPHQPVVIRAVDSLHLRTQVVAFPHPYFAAIDDKGEFRIEGVPAGRWTLRIWYRDGWLEGVSETLDVSARRTEKVKELTIPPALQTKPAGE
jgi:hypothetical protein